MNSVIACGYSFGIDESNGNFKPYTISINYDGRPLRITIRKYCGDNDDYGKRLREGQETNLLNLLAKRN